MLLFQRHRRHSGMVLLMVLVVIITMSILLTTMLSQNMSQVFSSQDKVDQIKAEELARGAYWKAYMDISSGTAPTVSSETLDGKTFTVGALGGKPADSTVQYPVSVSY